jgi:hypothetical protein
VQHCHCLIVIGPRREADSQTTMGCLPGGLSSSPGSQTLELGQSWSTTITCAGIWVAELPGDIEKCHPAWGPSGQCGTELWGPHRAGVWTFQLPIPALPLDIF